MKLGGKKILLACGVVNAAIVLYHIAFLFFGMGENYDSRLPALTLAVAGVFVVFTAYTISGAGIIRRLPLMKPALAIPATIYTLYGLALLLQRAGILATPGTPDERNFLFGFFVAAGAIALGIGHFIGLRTADERA